MDLRHLSDEALHINTVSSVQGERESTIRVLHHLRENERRRLYSKMRYKNLHAYAEAELKYPGDQAYRRIAAMKLLKEPPKLEEKIRSGALSLTHINDAQKVFKKKRSTRSEKLELLASLSGTSTREARRIIVKVAPEPLLDDRVRPVSEDKMEFKFFGTYALDEKLKELVGRYAHTHPRITHGELIEKLADLGLEQVKEKSKSTARQQTDSKAEVSRQLWERDQSKCTECQSTYAVEEDHRIPKAAGGQYTLKT